MALAALAIAATPALAQHPDFPNADTDPDNWSAVTVSSLAGPGCDGAPSGGVECEFDAAQSDVPWAIEYWGNGPHTCAARLGAGSFSYDGTLTISGASWSAPYPSYWACSSVQPTGFPWEGDICMHHPSGETWVRQEMTISDNSYPVTGITFGQLEGSPDEESVRFGHPPAHYYPPASPASLTAIAFSLEGYAWNQQHAAWFPLTEVDIDPASEDPEQAPCGWPDLQA